MTTFAQRSFARGEIAPALYARVDLSGYATGLRTCRNFFVMRHGGGASRPGSTFVGEVNDSTKTVRLIPFIFNASQTYTLEFGDLYLRVIKDGVPLQDVVKTITGISNANPCVVTATAHGFSNGDEVALSGIAGGIGTYLNNRNFKIANVTTNTFSLQYMGGGAVDSTAFGGYTSGGSAGRVYTVASPYAYQDLPLIKLVQSADVITITHPSYAVYELDRLGDTSWTFTAVTFAPKTASPVGVAASGGPAGSTTRKYVVTAIDDTSGEESLPSSVATLGSIDTPTAASPVTVSWTAVSNATKYNVYLQNSGINQFLGVASGTSYTDVGNPANSSQSAPTARNPFSGAGNNPSCVGYFQQRLMFGNLTNDPEGVYGSKTGQFHNFTISTPLQDDDAVTFKMVGKQVNSVQHILDLGKLLVMTAGGEWACLGDASGVLKPTAINSKQYSYNGSSSLAPIVIGSDLLYVQARGNFIRNLFFDFMIDGYRGNDLTVFSSHLVDGQTIVDWTYSQIPNSIVWAARSDGTLLGLTYIKEQQMIAWHRHDFDGAVENVCCIPEGSEDVLYLVIRRTINGRTVRYIERIGTRYISDITQYIGMDAALTYDGRNTSATTMTLSGGTGSWDYTQTLTLTASTSQFSSSDIGNQVFMDLLDASGKVTERIRFTIDGYTSATVVTGNPDKNVPAGLQSTAITNWSKAVEHFSGLWHLEGKKVSVLGDGFVVASPNNNQSNYPTLTVTNGQVTLDKPYAVVSIGLPFICDIETLDVDTAQGESIMDKQKMITAVTAYVQQTRGVWAGSQPPSDDSVDPLEGLNELKIRQYEGYDDPVSLTTDEVEINIQSEWNNNGRAFLRQIDPLPMTVLAIAPAGYIPIGRSG